MKKQIGALLLSAATLASCVSMASCGSSDYDINVLFMTNTEQDAFYKDYFAQLETRFDCKIKFTGITFSDYYQSLKTALKDNAPDLFYIRPGDIKKFVDDDLITDLSGFMASDYFKENVDLSKIYSHAVDMYRYDGTNVGVNDSSAAVYGINLGFSTQCMGYNKRLVERKADEIKAAGLLLPWELGEGESYTFEEFAEVARICSDTTGGGADGNKIVYGLNMSTEIMPYIWSAGGDILKDGQPNIESREVKYVLNWLLEGTSGSDPFISREATWSEWVSDQVAFFSEVGSWETGGYEGIEGFEYDLMPWPSIDGDNHWYGQIGTSAVAVYKYSENLELAQKIAATFYESKTLDDMVKAGIALPLDIATAEGAYLTDDDIYFPANREIFIDVISGENGKYSPINNTYTSEWYDVFTLNLDTIWNKSETIDEYVTSKQAEMVRLYNAK